MYRSLALFFSLLFTLSTLIFLTGCAKETTTATPAATTTEVTDTTMTLDISTLTKDVLPSPGSTALLLRHPRLNGKFPYARTNPTWFVNGWVGYSIFKLFGDPTVYDPNGELWGVENILENIDLISEILAVSTSSLDASEETLTLGDQSFTVNVGIATDSTALDTPYPPGLAHVTDVAYQHQRTVTVIADSVEIVSIELAWAKIDGVSYVITKMIMPPTDPTEYNVTTFEFNENTNEIILNRTCRAADNEGGLRAGGYFLMRVELIGNRDTKAFTLRAIKRNDGNDYPNIESYIAAGVGDETVETNHYVIKAKFDSEASVMAGTAERYYCFISDVAEDDFAAYETATAHASATNHVGTKIEQLNDSSFTLSACAESEHIATVDALDYFTETDLPTADSNWIVPLLL